ncbi:hypothetical protein JS756_18965 [Streptomyces actuosus]|uniref:Uncharacterized protein n=1 Tax=Streptomyces actuosus TaxID=1885 RepID=A0ABS2VSP7_STRAS|nr:hypothetical protein [Streptomyces actuosus]MBN0046149.1 hypothetical protein [Streptomyces actuosus]
MYEYEIQKFRAAELIRRADQERLAREAVRVRRAARREAAQRSVEREDHTGRSGRRWSPRAA